MDTFVCYLYFHVGHTTNTPSNQDVHGENGDFIQGNTYDTVEPSHNAERTTTDVANSVHQSTTLPGIREPVYTNTQQDPNQDWNSTLIELENSMYATTLQQNKEPKYPETQREVKNVLYGNQLDTCVDSNT